jgi:hypothetical protein
VPAEVTVIEGVVAPVFHNNDPVNDPAVNVELPQLFTTVTVGAETLAFNGAATPLAWTTRTSVYSLCNGVGSAGRNSD